MNDQKIEHFVSLSIELTARFNLFSLPMDSFDNISRTYTKVYDRTDRDRELYIPYFGGPRDGGRSININLDGALTRL